MAPRLWRDLRHAAAELKGQGSTRPDRVACRTGYILRKE